LGKHLVLVGGGHAHLTVLKNLSAFIKIGHRVTMISLTPYHYYSGMGPGMLSGIYDPWEVRFHTKKMAEDQGGAFIEARVVRIDPDRRLLFLISGEKVPYDIASFNTGSEVPVESLGSTAQGNIFTVKPVVNLLRARRVILSGIKQGKTFRLVVIGGGPAGVEISANLWRLLDRNGGKGQITAIGGTKLLGDASEKVRHLALKSFSSRRIQVIEGNRVKTLQESSVTLSDGRRLDFDVALVAIGIRPSAIFQESGLPTGPDGGMLVNSHLQCTAHPDIYGGGDCISLQGNSLPKVGVYAVRQNPVLHHNLLAALEGGKLMDFHPQKHFLLIFNMGNGKGIFSRRNCVWEGRLAFLLKDYIDRKFMRKFQVSGEREDRSEIIE
jgi:NADH dehydrogenase FAD-containing subunit